LSHDSWLTCCLWTAVTQPKTKYHYSNKTREWYTQDASGNYHSVSGAGAGAAAEGAASGGGGGEPEAAAAAAAEEVSEVATGNRTAKDTEKWFKQTKKQQAMLEALEIQKDR